MNAQYNRNTKRTIRCEHCGNKTLMINVAEGKYNKIIEHDPDGEYQAWTEYIVKTLLCPNCENINVIQMSSDWDIYTIQVYDEPDFLDSGTLYLYPMSKDFADKSLKAQDIRHTYREAITCFKAELYTPSVVMCRKTIELLSSYFYIGHSSTLVGKLAKMRDNGIIDQKLYEWANVLRHFGNEAVHTSEKFSKEDTQDILDFTHALVEYCIDFDYKFEQLLQRRGKPNPSQDLEAITLAAETINTLIQALNAHETSVCYYAAMTLAQRNIELEKVIPVLLSLINNSKFSSNATNCLQAIGSKAVPELINALEEHTSHNVRAAAATLLGNIGVNSPDVITSLVKALKDQNIDVQYKVGIALEKIGFAAIETFVKMYTVP